MQTTNIPPKENVSYSKNTQTEESGNDAMPTRGSRLGGFDYYTLTYDDLDDAYEEDSLPGLGSGKRLNSVKIFELNAPNVDY